MAAKKKNGRPKGSLGKKNLKAAKKILKNKEIKRVEKDFDKDDSIVAPVKVSEISETNGNDRPQRDARGMFLPGNTLGTGAPKNPYRRILNKISEAEFTEVKEAVLDKARKGDLLAVQILCKYLMPGVPEPEALQVKLKTKTVKELAESMDAVIEHMNEGLISVSGADGYLKCLSQKRDFIQVAMLETRLNELDGRVKSVEKK
jgi:hypothetical protein